MPFAGWSPVGIAALAALAAGIVLLVAYAARRGLVHRELDGMDPAAEPGTVPVTEVPARHAPRRPVAGRSRTVGLAGALLLAAGLVLGAVALTGAGGTGTAGGGAADDCAQSWLGCPQATPPATPEP